MFWNCYWDHCAKPNELGISKLFWKYQICGKSNLHSSNYCLVKCYHASTTGNLLIVSIHIWLYANIYWPFQEGLMMTRHEKEKKITIMMNAFDRLLNVTYIWRYNLILLDIFSTYFPLKSLILHEMNHFFSYEGPSMKSEGTKFCVCIVWC